MSKVVIEAERFGELLAAEVKLNILKDICETENYISIADVKRIIEAGGKKND